MVGDVNLHGMQMYLVMSMWFIFGDDWNDMPCKTLFLCLGDDVIVLESRLLNFRVFIHACNLRPQTYFRSSLTRVRKQLIQKQRNSFDVDKIGSKRPLAIKSCFV